MVLTWSSVSGFTDHFRVFLPVFLMSSFRALATALVNGEVFNIGSETRVTINDLALIVYSTLIAEGYDLPSKGDVLVERVDPVSVYGPGFEDMLHRCPDISKAKAAMDWSPTKELKTIIAEVAKSLLAQGIGKRKVAV